MAYKLVKKLTTGQLADYTDEIRARRPGNIGPQQGLPGPEYALTAIAAAREAGWFVDESPDDDDIRNMDYLDAAEPLALEIVDLYTKYTSRATITKEEKKTSKQPPRDVQ